VSRRTEQLASLIRQAVQDVLARGLEDPRIKGMITVTGVTVTDDLHDATINVSILPAEHAELTMHGLRHAERHMRHAVSNRVEMRRVPTLRFKLDDSLKRQAGVLEALAKVAEERREGAPEADDDQQGEDAS
jgi:ribosome-binding factor A